VDYGEAIDYLMSFNDMERGHQASPNPTMSLASMRSLLSRLNDPHLGRPTVHVTGSKGKGSTLAMIAASSARPSAALYSAPRIRSPSG
jgi:dihydrofolate synthase/folylpolyglutamate synthase